MLDLVLKTLNSARLVLLKSNEHDAKINDDDDDDDDDGQDHMFRFIPLRKVRVDRSATFGEVATPKVLHDMHQVVDRQKRACSFTQLVKRHRDFHSWPVLTSNLTWYYEHRYRDRFQHSNLEQWLKDVRICRVSADNVSKWCWFSQ